MNITNEPACNCGGSIMNMGLAIEDKTARIAALEAENAKLRRQVEFVRRKHPKKLKSGPLMLDRCQCCDGWNGKCEPDCPNNEAAT